MNPYKVLGIRPNASKDEIEIAYKNIIESNNINANSDNPVEFLTEEKLSKVNQAFYTLTSEIKLKEIRDLIESEQFLAAETELNLITDKNNAEWNYLKGFVLLKKGWFSAGVTHLKTAVELNPENEEYRQTMQLLSRKLNQIKSNYARVAAQNNSQNNMDLCGGGAGQGMNSGGDMCGGNQGNAANILNSMAGGGNPLGGANPLGGGGNPLGGNMSNGNPLQNMLMQNLMSPNNMNMCGNGGGGMC
jgi:hypothetical protein